ncbi:MAG: phasin family protein [Dokdonella sp.]
MIEQMNSQMLAMGKNYADMAMKFQSLTMAGFERIADLQLKTFENRMSATAEFLSEASEVRDLEAAKAFFPKGVQLAKESAEKLYATSQEVFGVTLKTNEAIGSLVKGSFEMANENMAKQADVVKKAVSKK